MQVADGDQYIADQFADGAIIVFGLKNANMVVGEKDEDIFV